MNDHDYKIPLFIRHWHVAKPRYNYEIYRKIIELDSQRV